MPVRRLRLPTADDTADFAAQIAPRLAPGDVILLQGGLGAGKTHFARALIQTRLGVAEDVPSPTFTLVQAYEADGVEIWHADLYRLSHADEALELGLDEAFDTAICLIEWPDRLGPDRPDTALTVDLAPEGEGRIATLSYDDPRWTAILDDG